MSSHKRIGSNNLEIVTSPNNLFSTNSSNVVMSNLGDNEASRPDYLNISDSPQFWASVHKMHRDAKSFSESLNNNLTKVLFRAQAAIHSEIHENSKDRSNNNRSNSSISIGSALKLINFKS